MSIVWYPYQMANLIAMLISAGHDPAEFYTRREHMSFTSELILPHRIRYDHTEPCIVSFLQYPYCCDYLLEAVVVAIERDLAILRRIFYAQSFVCFKEEADAVSA